MSRVLINVEKRKFNKDILGSQFDQPFGFAPMGMCNLTWPGADLMLANESLINNIPTCLSMAASTSLEIMYQQTEGRCWMQIYIGQDEEFVMDILRRAEIIGFKNIILTVDVPVLSRRVRDERNGWSVPFKMGFNQFLDFAFHPRWSLSSLYYGIPKPMNYVTSKSGKKFLRGESRGSTDWSTLDRVRNTWKGNLIVKGVMSSEDAIKIKTAGADAVYVSNHGGRQLDSAPSSISTLPSIRKALGANFPLIFDSGIRSGSDVIRALSLGADYVMIGRPLMYGIGADGASGLRKVLNILKEEISTTLALIGLNEVSEISSKVIAENNLKNINY